MKYLKRKTNGFIRYVLIHCFSRSLNLYTINEYPKSGGTWLGQMLAKALDLPFPRNAFPMLTSSIMHGHYFSPWGMKNVLVLWRDGRDVMVSFYYHCLFENERENVPLVNTFRKDLQFEDFKNVRENLPRFIEYSLSKPRYPRFSWVDFVHRWHGRNDVTYARYEDLRSKTALELQRIVHELTQKQLTHEQAEAIAEEFSFARQSGRQPGDEVIGSFLRKGVVGDWKNIFSLEAKRTFNRLAGEALILAGYEKDSSWVKE